MSEVDQGSYWRDRGILIPSPDDELEEWEQPLVLIPDGVTEQGREQIERAMASHPRCDESFQRKLCSESRAVLALGIAKGGSRQVRLACFKCGKAFSSALSLTNHPGHPQYPVLNLEDQLAWAEDRRQRLRDERDIDVSINAALLLERNRGLREAEARTPRGRSFRERILRRDGRLCQCCLDATATEIHHLNYHDGTHYVVPATDVIGICRPCHERFLGTVWQPGLPKEPTGGGGT